MFPNSSLKPFDDFRYFGYIVYGRNVLFLENVWLRVIDKQVFDIYVHLHIFRYNVTSTDFNAQQADSTQNYAGKYVYSSTVSEKQLVCLFVHFRYSNFF